MKALNYRHTSRIMRNKVQNYLLITASYIPEVCKIVNIFPRATLKLTIKNVHLYTMLSPCFKKRKEYVMATLLQ